MKRKWKNKKRENKNVKTQNEMKKFPNHFGRWIAEDAPPLYCVPLKPSNM